MKRRHFIKTTGISIGASLLYKPHQLFAEEIKGSAINYPDEVSAIVNEQLVKLIGKAGYWEFNDTVVKLRERKPSLEIEIESLGAALSEVRLHWNVPSKATSLLLNDHWERTYGDSSWHKLNGEELFPWFFMEYHSNATYGFGVKTGCNTFCGWLVSDGKMALVVDTRNGANGVNLGQRKLKAAEIVTFKSKEGETHFAATRRFAKMMCDKPRLPEQPVYGINDWYLTYGNNSADLIMKHTELIAPMAAGLQNRPFSVIDDGWFVVTQKGKSADVLKPNNKFGDMQKLAGPIKNAGMRPGLWTRPLLAVEHTPENLLLRNTSNLVYDPSIAENLERVSTIFKTYKEWKYEMIKFDYTSWDIFQKWGFQMMHDKKMAKASDWHMNDKTKTNVEIILGLYKTIRDAAGSMYIIGCNTFSHLSAGLFELNRIGDDTSGNEWSRTKKMGVNTLAARGFTHNIFYSADPDCVGLTTKIDWSRNKQWMELVAKSGTPLFISAQPEAVGAEQRQSIKECLALASHNIPVGEPIDWMENSVPKKWKLNGVVEEFDWG
jgi:alpha-galactosidase